MVRRLTRQLASTFVMASMVALAFSGCVFVPGPGYAAGSPGYVVGPPVVVVRPYVVVPGHGYYRGW